MKARTLSPAEQLEELQNCGVRFVYLTPYQIRIENELDIYPKKKRWHDLRSKKRGGYKELVPFVRHFLTKP